MPGVSFYSQGFTSNMTYRGSLRQDQHIYFDGMNIGPSALAEPACSRSSKSST